MPIRADQYQIILRFSRLFPDPVVFEDQNHIANRFLLDSGLSEDKSKLICQTGDEIIPTDDNAKPSVATGTAKYPFQGRTIIAEYMSNANIPLSYVDFGTGLAPDDHSKLWKRGRLGELKFELRDFKHQAQTLNIPDIRDIYKILKDRATPSALSTIELDKVPGHVFQAIQAYIENQLQSAANNDGLEIEIYAAKDLSNSEKAALEKRLTRESTKSTIFVILSREPVATQVTS